MCARKVAETRLECQLGACKKSEREKGINMKFVSVFLRFNWDETLRKYKKKIKMNKIVKKLVKTSISTKINRYYFVIPSKREKNNKKVRQK